MARKLSDKIDSELQEEIFQTYILLGKKTETAKACKVSIPTVTKVLKTYAPEDIDKARSEVVAQIAGRLNDKVLMAIDAFCPEDFTGKIGGKAPTLMQKATAAAIMIDKRVLLEKHVYEYRKLQEEARASARPIPQDVPALVGAIQNMLKTLAPILPMTVVSQPAVTEMPAVVVPEYPISVEGKKNIALEDFDNANIT